MKKFPFLILCLILIIPIKAQKNSIKWVPSESVNMGFPQDYSGFSRYFDRKTGITFFLANDDKNLYIKLEAVNEAIQMKLIQLGMVLEFQLSDHTENIARIDFPPDAQSKNEVLPSVQRSDIAKLKQSHLWRANQFFTEGFQRSNGQLTLGKPEGLRARISVDSMKMNYEVIIPLVELVSEKLRKKDLSRLEILMTATIDAFPQPNRARANDFTRPATDRFGNPISRRPGTDRFGHGGMDMMGTAGNRFAPVNESYDLLFRRQSIKRNFRLSHSD